jgi:hypothetical protein
MPNRIRRSSFYVSVKRRQGLNTGVGAAPPDNGMHATRDTLPLIYQQRLWRAGDHGRWAARLTKFADGTAEIKI